MTRIVTTAAAILILTIAIGCESNTGISQQLPQRTGSYASSAEPLPTPGSSDQIDLVEQLTSYRQAYRRSLQTLIQHYDAVGDNQKATWAQEELTALDRIPMYRYIIEADLPSNLKAVARIPAADELYNEAAKLERVAGALPVLKDEEVLRGALAKYAEVIRKYPTSDKIDDAAYRMGHIQDYFKDYALALLSFQRAYQWDTNTPYPARFRAANILDRRLHRRNEALSLYQEAIIKEASFNEWRIPAERRVKELTTSGSN
jgi:tetratricopeptide (TPR) repeat protein